MQTYILDTAKNAQINNKPQIISRHTQPPSNNHENNIIQTIYLNSQSPLPFNQDDNNNDDNNNENNSKNQTTGTVTSKSLFYTASPETEDAMLRQELISLLSTDSN